MLQGAELLAGLTGIPGAASPGDGPALLSCAKTAGGMAPELTPATTAMDANPEAAAHPAAEAIQLEGHTKQAAEGKDQAGCPFGAVLQQLQSCLVGKKVMVRWSCKGKWKGAVVKEFNTDSDKHRIHLEKTEDKTDSWVQLANMSSKQLAPHKDFVLTGEWYSAKVPASANPSTQDQGGATAVPSVAAGKTLPARSSVLAGRSKPVQSPARQPPGPVKHTRPLSSIMKELDTVDSAAHAKSGSKGVEQDKPGSSKQVVKQQPKKPSNDTNALLHQPGSARRSRQALNSKVPNQLASSSMNENSPRSTIYSKSQPARVHTQPVNCARAPQKSDQCSSIKRHDGAEPHTAAQLKTSRQPTSDVNKQEQLPKAAGYVQHDSYAAPFRQDTRQAKRVLKEVQPQAKSSTD